MTTNDTSEGRGFWEWDLVKLLLVPSFLLLIFGLWSKGFTEEGVRLNIRWTARISVFLFCIAFAASALHLWLRNSLSFWINMNRKYWGISFAIVHLVHLCFLGILQMAFHPVFNLAASFSLFAGGMAYFFVVTMLLTSFPLFAKHLSRKQWSFLHTVGGYWIWTIFMSSYWNRAVEDTNYLPIAILLVLVFFLRMWALIKKRKIA